MSVHLTLNKDKAIIVWHYNNVLLAYTYHHWMLIPQEDCLDHRLYDSQVNHYTYQ